MEDDDYKLGKIFLNLLELHRLNTRQAQLLFLIFEFPITWLYSGAPPRGQKADHLYKGENRPFPGQQQQVLNRRKLENQQQNKPVSSSHFQ